MVFDIILSYFSTHCVRQSKTLAIYKKNCVLNIVQLVDGVVQNLKGLALFLVLCIYGTPSGNGGDGSFKVVTPPNDFVYLFLRFFTYDSNKPIWMSTIC